MVIITQNLPSQSQLQNARFFTQSETSKVVALSRCMDQRLSEKSAKDAFVFLNGKWRLT